jgi:exosome complex component CSL4
VGNSGDSLLNKEPGNLPDKYVLPGDEIGISEEYLPGRNVIDLDGKLFSLAYGKVQKDDVRLVMSVRTGKEKMRPRMGELVFGQVVKDDRGSQTVRVGAYADREGHLHEIDFTGIIRQPRGHGEERMPPIKVGDYVRAKIIREGDFPELGVLAPNLGVIMALCSNCRTLLVKSSSGLKCPNCDNMEQRKTAKDYGIVLLPNEKGE